MSRCERQMLRMVMLAFETEETAARLVIEDGYNYGLSLVQCGLWTAFDMLNPAYTTMLPMPPYLNVQYVGVTQQDQA
jgi:hypothetical protein